MLTMFTLDKAIHHIYVFFTGTLEAHEPKRASIPNTKMTDLKGWGVTVPSLMCHDVL